MSKLRYVLLAGSIQELQNLLNSVGKKSQAVGLYLNVCKTKCIIIETMRQHNLHINDAETVDEFISFEATLTNDYDDSKEMRTTIKYFCIIREHLERQIQLFTDKKQDIFHQWCLRVPVMNQCWEMT